MPRREVGQAAALHVFQLHHGQHLLAAQARFMHQRAARVRQGDDFRAHLQHLFGGVLGHVAAAADGHALAFKAFALAREHFLREVGHAVARGFGAHQAAAKAHAFAGEDAGGAVAELFHHAGHVAHFARAHANVASGHVGVRADVAEQLLHQRLAKAHDFGVALAFGVKVGAALAAAHGQRGERVFEALLESQEFQNRQIHAGVKAHAALVGANGLAVLDAKGAIDLRAALVVGPAHAKLHHAVRLAQALQQGVFAVLRVLLQEGPEAGKHLAHGLQKFRLVRIAPLHIAQKVFKAGCGCHFFSFSWK